MPHSARSGALDRELGIAVDGGIREPNVGLGGEWSRAAGAKSKAGVLVAPCVCEEAAFDGRYNIRLHPTHVSALARPAVCLRSGDIVTPRGAGEPNR